MIRIHRPAEWHLERFTAPAAWNQAALFPGARANSEPQETQGGGAATKEAPSSPDVEQPPGPEETLAAFQEENRQLRERIARLSAAGEEAQQVSRRLEESMEANEQLRRRYRELALIDAVRRAGDSLGIPAEVAMLYTRKFQCIVDRDGAADVTPNPTEFLLAELKGDPLLRESVSRAGQARRADAVASGIEAVEQVEPTELMAVLDRSPSKKARFIARHGTQAYVDLAAKARRKGYRG